MRDQAVNVGIERAIVDRLCLTTCELLQSLWERAARRHLCAIDEHRDDANFSIEGLLDLNANEVVRAVNPPASGLRISYREPSLADQRQQDVASVDPFTQGIDEICSWWDRIDIDEQVFFWQHSAECLVNHSRL